MVVTETGVTFRAYAARICTEVDMAREAVSQAGELQGRMRIAAPLSFGPTHFAPILASLGRRHSKLQVLSSYTDRFVDLVGEGFDCAIRVGYLPDSHLVAKRVGPMFGKLVASPIYIDAQGAPQTPQEISNHRVAMREAEVWKFVDGDDITAVRPNGSFIADNALSLVAAAVAGLGLAYLPEPLVLGSTLINGVHTRAKL
jgi:DNA-binding transcriptional LysR family regulator